MKKKRNKLSYVAEQLLRFYVVLCIICIPSISRAEYSYVELFPPGWSLVSADAINDNGVVVGQGYDGAGVSKGFIYSGGTYTELLPPGWSEAYAYGINNSGAIVGSGYDAKDVMKGFITTFQSACDVWSDVIAKYNAYVSGQAPWNDVIICYNQYASP